MDLTQIALALIALAGTIVTAIIVPVLKTKLNNDQLANLYAWVKIAVQAAEQLCITNKLAPDDRKTYVLDFLKQNGFTIDLDKIEDLIESIVFELPPTEIKEVADNEEDSNG